MMEPNDALLGEIALEWDFIDPKQLRDALKACRGQTPPKPLGAVLVAQGLLRGDQLLEILDEVRRRAEGGPAGSAASTPLPEQSGAERPSGKPSPPAFSLDDRYKVKGEIARGGMGVILEGQDLEIRRDLAIKVLIEGESADDESRIRFLEEAQIQGQLEHPNICPVHELGKDARGRPYFTMKKVKGKSLFNVFEDLRAGRDGAGYTLPRLLGVFVKVCDAVAFAHSKGVLHRDLKPHNVMIGEFGEVLVMDWGLAKVVGRKDDPARSAVISDRAEAEIEISLQGSILGTPAYMPPEQAQGRLELVDPRSDVYSLGAILYEILTLRSPVDGKTAREVIERVAKGEIVAPSRRAPERGIPADLEAATLKALATERGNRYASVLAFRDDIAAFLEGRTIAAAEYSLVQLAAKWFRRNRVFATTAAVSALLLLAGAGIYVVNVTRARDERAAEALRARKAEGEAAREAQLARAAERSARLNLAESLVAQGDSYVAVGRWSEAKDLYRKARQGFRDSGAPTLKADLAIEEAARLSPPPLIEVPLEAGGYGLALLPDGRRALVALESSRLGLVDLVTGRILRSFAGHTDVVWRAAVTPDGRRAVSASWDGTLKSWEIESGRCLGSFLGHKGAVMAVVVAPDGATVCSAGSEGTIRWWDLETGRPKRTLTVSSRRVTGVAFSPDGKKLISGDMEGKVRLWNAETGEPIRLLGVHRGSTEAVAFSPDGRLALSGGSDHAVKVWDAETGAEPRAFQGHTGILRAVSFSPDGRRVVSAGNDHTVRVWEVETAREISCLVGHANDVYGAAFLPDGRRVVSIGYDRFLRVWDAREAAPFARFTGSVIRAALSPDGRLSAAAQADGRVALWDTATGLALRRIDAHEGPVTDVVFLPDGDRIVSCGVDAKLAVWDLDSGRALHSMTGHVGPVRQVAVTPDGKRAVTAGDDHTVGVWDLASGKRIHALKGHQWPVQSVAVTPDGRRAVTGFNGNSMGDELCLRFWDLEAGREESRLGVGGVHGVYSLAYRADGERLVGALGHAIVEENLLGPLAVWDVPSARRIQSYPGHTAAVRSAVFSPDGKLVLSGGQDGTARVFDAESGREIRILRARKGPVTVVAASPEGRWFLAASGDEIDRWPLEASEVPIAKPVEPGEEAALGEIYAARGQWDWAVDLLGRARENGARVSPLLLARCRWQTGDRAGARREFERANSDREAPDPHLRRCVAALRE